MLFHFKSWFDTPKTQMPIFLLFVRAGVLFDGTFSLWVSLSDAPFSKFAWRIYKCWYSKNFLTL